MLKIKNYLNFFLKKTANKAHENEPNSYQTPNNSSAKPNSSQTVNNSQNVTHNKSRLSSVNYKNSFFLL